MIVMWHFYFHGIYLNPHQQFYFSDSTSIYKFNFFTSEFIASFLSVCVNCYVILTGYFMVDTKFKISRLCNILFQTIFYSVIISFSFYLIKSNISLNDVFKSLFVLRNNKYWFVTQYIGLALLSPFLNQMCENKKKHFVLLVVLIFLNIDIILDVPYGILYSGGHQLLFFILLYLSGAYIKRHLPTIHFSKKDLLLILFVLCILNVGIRFLKRYIYGEITHGLPFSMFEYNGLSYFMSICFFLYFKTKEFNNSNINSFLVKVAPYSFGVYLIHDHELMRQLIWNIIYKWYDIFSSPYFLIIVVTTAISIFLISILIDYSRHLFMRLLHINTLFHKLDKLQIVTLSIFERK